MMIKNIKNIALVLCLGSALSTGTIFAGQEGNNTEKTRENLLNEAISLLDKIELSSPRSQVEVMKIRERLLKLQNNYCESSENSSSTINYVTLGGTASKVSRANKVNRINFYKNCDDLKDDALLEKLRSEISKAKSITYGEAREVVFLDLDNHGGNVECVYTGQVYKVGKEMPSSTLLNIEHTWPQSLGAKGVAKSDLHHLFPTEAKANAHRSSLPFGDISDPNPSYVVGGSRCDGSVFEVRKQHRGNVARAMFYFSTRYNKPIDPKQEATLRKWHKEDPVDANEIARNDAIEAIQHNRNPFIDHPEYVDKINNF